MNTKRNRQDDDAMTTGTEKEYFERLTQFTRKECDRFEYLTSFLKEERLPHEVIILDQNRFILLRTATSGRESPLKIFSAHYDRASGSPGANDNSAAVIALLFFFRSLIKKDQSPMALLLSDQEEIQTHTSLTEQGSFKLGKLLKSDEKSRFIPFHFDMCGRGDTVIVSEAGERLLERRGKTHTGLYQNMKTIKTAVLDGLSDLYRGRILTLPTPFSDNLGFLLQGIPALQVTLLPFREAFAYLRDYKKLTSEISSHAVCPPETKKQFLRRFHDIQPETWKLRHTEKDTVESLTTGSFPLLRNLFEALVRCRIPLL